MSSTSHHSTTLQSEDKNTQNTILFRNHEPRSEFLSRIVRVEKRQPESLTDHISNLLALAEIEDLQEFDRTMFEKRKDNLDLKRRISKKMELLDQETRKSIERLRKKSKD